MMCPPRCAMLCRTLCRPRAAQVMRQELGEAATSSGSCTQLRLAPGGTLGQQAGLACKCTVLGRSAGAAGPQRGLLHLQP